MKTAFKILTKVVLITTVTLLLSYYALHAAMPDCTPNQHDGQCGLATALAFMYSIILTSVVAVVSILFFTIRHFRERDRREAAEHP